MDRQKVRTPPQKERTTKFTQADTRVLGNLSTDLGRLYWQNLVGGWENQVALLLRQQERLNSLVADLLMREL